MKMYRYTFKTAGGLIDVVAPNIQTAQEIIDTTYGGGNAIMRKEEP
jgi:hypothetical protein